MTGTAAAAAGRLGPASVGSRLILRLRARGGRSIASGTIAIVTVALTSLVAVLVAGAAHYIFLEAETTLARRADTVAAILSSAAGNPLWDLDHDNVAAMLGGLATEPDIVSAEILDDQGAVFARSAAPAATRRPSLETELTRPISIERGGGPRVIGSLRLTYTAALARRGAWRQVDALVGGGVVATLMVAICLARVLRRLTVPMAGLTAVMEALQHGRYDDAVVPATGRADEIGAMARSLNGTLNELRFLNHELEARNQRFDAALHTMAQGLCMLNDERRVIVYNQRFLDLFALTRADVDQARPWQHVAARIAEQGSFHADDVRRLDDFGERSANRTEGSVVLRSPAAQRFVAMSHRSAAGGVTVATFEDVSERQRAEQRIAHMARHDALTDLPNRLLLRESLTQALVAPPAGEPPALLYLDLDRFKAVNDTLGHQAGDALLTEVAGRIQRELRGGDLVARLGGDEFAILLPVGGAAAASALAQRLVASVGEPYVVMGRQASVGVSVGIALAAPGMADPDELFRRADLALYRSKANGRGRPCFYRADMDDGAAARRVLEGDLRQALGRSEFVLHYSPQVDLRDGRVCGVEASLRWNHPTRGKVPPAEFIHVAEEIGLIAPIGNWVLQQACCDAAAWHDARIRVAVNVSPVQFRSTGLVDIVTGALTASGLAPSRLEIEAAESVLLTDRDATLKVMHGLRAAGVGIALADFGTGCSSLGALRMFPFDKIKIDQSFTRELGCDAGCDPIVAAVAELGARLGMTTIAAGVATPEQLDRVRRAGCHEAQGSFFGAPRDARDLALWLAQRGSAPD